MSMTFLRRTDGRGCPLVFGVEGGLLSFQIGGADAREAAPIADLEGTPGSFLRVSKNGTSSRRHLLHPGAAHSVIVKALSSLVSAEGVRCVTDEQLSCLDRFAWARPKALPGGDWASLRSVDNLSLRPYQQEGCRWLSSMGLHGLLGDEMGLGKTIQVCAALEMARPARRRCLVVTTKSTVCTWPVEAARWAPSWSSFALMAGSKAKKAFEHGLVVVSWGLLPRVLDSLLAWAPDTLVVDEAHYLGSGYKSERFRAVAGLSGVASSTLLMTGTPLTNRPADLWPLLHLLDPINFSVFPPFGRNFCDPTIRYLGLQSFVKYDGSSNPEQLSEILSGVQLRRKKEDVLSEIPPRIEVCLPVEVPKETKKHWLSTLKRIRNSGQGQEADALLPEIGAAWRMAGLAKVEATADRARELVEAGEGPVIILIFHEDVRIALTEALRDLRVGVIVGETSAVNRFRLIERFQSGEIDVMIGSTALREGATLTRSHHVIQAEYWWTEAGMDQGASRAHRFGQQSVVHVDYMHGTGTVDDHMRRLVKRKKEFREEIVEAAAMRTFVKLLASGELS